VEEAELEVLAPTVPAELDDELALDEVDAPPFPLLDAAVVDEPPPAPGEEPEPELLLAVPEPSPT
jgi:hypothetical protein